MKPFWLGMLYATAIYFLNLFLINNYDINIGLPWSPISVIGIAVAFYLGFKNNASYDRVWEARKIWGGIVNNSRSFGAATHSFIIGKDAPSIKKRIIYRHIAWLTALRYQLRLPREWEHDTEKFTRIFPSANNDYLKELSSELQPFLSDKELNECISKANVATQIIAAQATDLQTLRDENYFDDFRHMEFHQLLTTFYDDQGRSERIKNFPFPRQYASTALWLSVIFSLMIPFGLLDILNKMPIELCWIMIPLSGLTIWVFFLMEKIGDYSENPFEGSYNDVPIDSISRAIEIDLREMINDTNLRAPIGGSPDGFLM
ncbi:bestrophin family protein [Flavobacterium litorale]|uniref:Multidrug transporter n=1 Tax=Flavobacterium litorale TaxID=2856519 RepID=A0ABX8V5G4_9FLAO|nr:bestrophin family ion channel [Flavobacterium litorale]QYJ68085.1 multidrug transporter [Flavobacterium litorale]